LRHLDRRVFRPHLVVLRAEGDFAGLVPDDVAVDEIDGARYPDSLPRLTWTMFRLARRLSRIRPPSALSTRSINLAPALSRPLLPRTTRIVLRESSVLSVRLQTDTQHPQLWRWLYRRLYRWAHVVVCQSESTVGDMVDQFDVPRD